MAVVKARALGVRPCEVGHRAFPLVFSLGGRRFSNFFSPLGFRVRLWFSIGCYLRSDLRAVASLFPDPPCGRGLLTLVMAWAGWVLCSLILQVPLNALECAGRAVGVR